MAIPHGVLLDLDGVLYVGNRVLPGAVEAVARLRAAGIRIRYVTNTTRTPHRLLLAKLRRLGLEVASEELFSPSGGACALIATEGWRPHLLVHPALLEDFAGLAQPGDAREAVVLGDAGAAFSYAAMNAAFRALERGAAFLALANNRYFRDDDGDLSLDAGPFAAALTFATGQKPRVVGKPAPDFFHAALASMGVAPQEAAMVGDDVESDVGGAMAAGLTGVLVRTGKYVAGAEMRISPGPDALADDLAAWVNGLLG